MFKNLLMAGLFVMVGCSALLANEWNPIIDVSGLSSVGDRPETLNSEPSFLAIVAEPETPTVQDPAPTPAYEDVWVTEYQTVCVGGQCFQQPVRRLVRKAIQPAMAVASKSIDVVQNVVAAPVYAMETVVETAVLRTSSIVANRQFRPLRQFRQRMAAFHQRRAMRLSR